MTTDLPARVTRSRISHDAGAHPLPLSLPHGLRVGVCAPDEVVRKVCYALEELLVAAGIPHRVNRADACDGWDLFYGDQPPGDGSLWMAASPAAWRFLTERGGRIDGVETVRTAGHWARLPDWNAGRPAGRDAVPAVTGAGRSPLPDLAAAAFFFLSHREEWGAPERDRFGRFPLSASVFGRGLWSLIECPVERYARALRQAVSERLPAEARLRSDPSTATMEGDEDEEIPAGQPRPAFLLGLSHDVDTVRRWDGRGFARTGRELLRALVRGHVQKAQAETRCLLAGIQARRNGRDPHDNLEQIVMLEREAGASSTFFLLARQTHRWDGTHPLHYQRRLPALARSLVGKAEIGLHASTAADSASTVCEERDRLNMLSGTAVRGLRYHNLRGGFGALPDVAAAGFTYDSSLAFAEELGFSSGIARPFRLYDREQDRPQDMIEIPLALMDTSLLSSRYLGLDCYSGRQRARLILETVRRWNGAAALLWHNDNLPPNPAGGYASLYAELLDDARAADGQLVSLGDIADDWLRTRAALQDRTDTG